VAEKRLSNQGQPPPSTGAPALGRRSYQQGLQTLVWKGDDANGDDLTFDVAFRREGEAAWTVLATKLSDAIYVWDTTSVPNGTYVVKVVASDTPSNTPGASLEGELESSAFDIDNGPPVIDVSSSRQANARTTIQFDVRDDWSSISKVEYSLDAQRWQVVYPRDGIFDSRNEQFELTLDNTDAVKGLIIRAYDAKNNSATARGDVPTAR